MDLLFNNTHFKQFDTAIQKEWIETDYHGNYSCSSIVGINTRKRHGLYVAKNQQTGIYSVLLSHLQEEFFTGKEQCQLCSVDYDTESMQEGFQYQNEFRLDPFPTFVYLVGKTQIEKFVFFIKDTNRLIISYKISGISGKANRLVVKPFFAFRPISESSDPELFDNEEFFFMENQIRFLPFPEAPELFMQHSEGQFHNVPMWYHNFYYRNDSEQDPNREDLLNPGFFEFEIKEDTRLFLSVTLYETEDNQLATLFNEERERRLAYHNPSKNKNQVIAYFFKRIENFKRTLTNNGSFFVSDLTSSKFNLSLYCLMASRLLNCGIRKKIAEKYYIALLKMLSDRNLLEVLMGLHLDIQVDAASPFFLVFFLYNYHIHFDRGKSARASLKMITEIIQIIRKNQLHFYRMKRNKLLEREYQKSDSDSREDYALFYPLRQNFILNVFWYNAIMMACHLAELNDMNMRRMNRWHKKIKSRFYQQYFKSFAVNPPNALDSYSFVLHPAMIYTVTLPFSILEERESQVLYRVLITQFLTKMGIKFPVRNNGDVNYLISPLLLGEYLDGWQKLMKEKDFLKKFFVSIADELKNHLKTGIVGYIPDILASQYDTKKLARPPSGVATSEVLYFLYRVSDINR
jgi:glycogen debranching enzyme